MALRYYRNGPARALAFPLANGTDTSITVDSASGFPTQFPYTIILDPDTSIEEVCDVTFAAGNVLTLDRGVDSTTAVAHAAGAVVYHGISARDPREANAHVNATTNVHGITGSFVDTASVQNIPGQKIFDDLETTGGGDVVTVGATQAITGTKTFTDARTATGGAVLDVGSTQAVTGQKTFTDLQTVAGGPVVALAGIQAITGAKSFSGTVGFSGTNSHSGSETFTGTVTLGTEPLTGAWSGYAVERRNGAGGAPLNTGNGTLTGRYKKIGDKTVLFRVLLSYGTTTNIGSTTYVFTLPFTPADNRQSGSVILFHAGIHQARTWHGIGGTEIVLIDQAGTRVDFNTPVAWASGDAITITGMYEAA